MRRCLCQVLCVLSRRRPLHSALCCARYFLRLPHQSWDESLGLSLLSLLRVRLPSSARITPGAPIHAAGSRAAEEAPLVRQ